MVFFLPGGFSVPGRVFSVPKVFFVPSSSVFFVPAMGVEGSRKGVLCSPEVFFLPGRVFFIPVELGRPRVFFVPVGCWRTCCGDEVREEGRYRVGRRFGESVTS